MLLDFSQSGITFLIEITEDNSAYLKCCANGESSDKRDKKARWCPLAELQISGTNPDDHHGFKHTGTYGCYALKYVSHSEEATDDGKIVAILLSDGRINATVYYRFYNGIVALRSWTVVENTGNEAIGLEYVSSFAYTGLDDGERAGAEQAIRVAIPHNDWVRELNWRFYTLPELGLNRISTFSTKRLSYSNTGTWSSKEFLPMGFTQNEDTRHCWLWQIENNGSWQWEIGEINNMLYVKVSGPTEQENGWYKSLKPGERFESVKVALSMASDFESAVCEMTKYRRKIFRNNKENEKLPVVFNDYMHCLWADPTEEKELPIIDKAAAAGADYFCMDAGWYADGGWWETVGEWLPIERRFPNGIKKVFDYVREKGMVPGIWLEIEVMGIHCPLAEELGDEYFFMRHGKRVIDHGRYHLDFRNPKVRAFATAVVDRVIGEYGVGYIKMDYNIDGGLGTELNADSFGDGLLQCNRAYLEWIDEIQAKYPALIWENCGSGGMRMDYAMLSKCHLQSVSDQEKYTYTAPIAAAAPTAVLPEQAAVWACPLADAGTDSVVFNMVNALLQRIHLSGNLAELSAEGFSLVQEGVSVYKSYRDFISSALPFWPLGLPSQQSPWVAMGLSDKGKKLLAVWRLQGENDCVFLPEQGDVKVVYPQNSDAVLEKEENGVTLTLSRRYTAVLLEVL